MLSQHFQIRKPPIRLGPTSSRSSKAHRIHFLYENHCTPNLFRTARRLPEPSRVVPTLPAPTSSTRTLSAPKPGSHQSIPTTSSHQSNSPPNHPKALPPRRVRPLELSSRTDELDDLSFAAIRGSDPSPQHPISCSSGERSSFPPCSSNTPSQAMRPSSKSSAAKLKGGHSGTLKRELHTNASLGVVYRLNANLSALSVDARKRAEKDAQEKAAKAEAAASRETEKRAASKVLIKRIERNEREYVTEVCGLEAFGLELKKVAEEFG